MLQEFLTNISAYVADILVYTAIFLVAMTGVFKCVAPVSRNAGALKKGVRKLENGVKNDGAPAWQDGRFLGRGMQPTWQRFLTNAEQMDVRGLSLDVAEYVNDETVIEVPGRGSLADLIPGLLTSLGILGTFIGLMRGLSGLDMTDASKLMAGIPTLINGMKTAFATSIAGVTCSLGFNFLYRMVVGRAMNAIDDFEDAFKQLALGRSVDCDVQLVCQQQDQNVILHRTADDMSQRIAGSIEVAIGRAMQPVAASMDSFIAGATREQMEGLQRIVSAFVKQMNTSLGGQFQQLGATLADLREQQGLSVSTLTDSMRTAQALVDNVTAMQATTGSIMSRFEEYVQAMAQARKADETFENRTGNLLESMHAAAQEQASYLSRLRDYQGTLQSSFQQYTAWNDKIMDAVRGNSRDTQQRLSEVAQQMDAGSRSLQANYAAFSEEISGGLAKTLGMFDASVKDMIVTLDGKLDELKEAAKGQNGTERDAYVASLARLEAAIAQMTKAIDRMNGKEE